jgi:hypothetical protein
MGRWVTGRRTEKKGKHGPQRVICRKVKGEHNVSFQTIKLVKVKSLFFGDVAHYH